MPTMGRTETYRLGAKWLARFDDLVLRAMAKGATRRKAVESALRRMGR